MREIRSSGSVRGVRSDPYPYRDMPQPAAIGSALFRDTEQEPEPAHSYGWCCRCAPKGSPEPRTHNARMNEYGYMNPLGMSFDFPSLKSK
jgi:hypothetical protein